jgi:hypothetical protein
MTRSGPGAEPDRCVATGCDAAVRRTRLAIVGEAPSDRAKCDRGHRLIWTVEAGWQPVGSAGFLRGQSGHLAVRPRHSTDMPGFGGSIDA